MLATAGTLMLHASQKPKLHALGSISASSGFLQCRTASFHPRSRSWSLLPPCSCPAPRNTASLSKLAGGSPAKAANPVGSGMRELGQSQGRAPGWPLWLGADGEVVAAAAPSRDGRLPISPSQQQLLLHSPGCSCCRWGELPHSLCQLQRTTASVQGRLNSRQR